MVKLTKIDLRRSKIHIFLFYMAKHVELVKIFNMYITIGAADLTTKITFV